jgi:hypothetical protein
MADDTFGVSMMRTPLCRKIWQRLLGQRSWTKHAGSFREKEFLGLVTRANYTYGMLRAADTAAFFGKSEVTVCEFGVATGMGLTNMTEVAALIQAETGVRFRVVGFDTGAGLPPPTGYKDHPELWSGGDFAMEDPALLIAKLKGKAELILGDINDTIDAFTATLTPACPLGFVSIDVDIYSGTVSALRALGGSPESYLPAISFYLDDVGSYFSNFACGELCAVNEHNQAHPTRPIDIDRSLPGRRPDAVAAWYRSMYVCHVLDHPFRIQARERGSLSLQDHLKFMAALR